VISKSLDSLIEALRYPLRGYTLEEENQWLEEQLEILDIIKEYICKNICYPLNVKIKKELRWYQLYARQKRLENKVNDVLDCIKEDYEFRLYRAVQGDFREYLDDTEKPFDEIHKETDREMVEVCNLLRENEKTAKDIFDKFDKIIKEFDSYGISVNPSHLFARFTEQYPELSVEVSGLIMANSDEVLGRFFSSFLWPLKRIEGYSTKLKQLIRKGIEAKNLLITLNIAHAYAWGGLLDEFDSGDIKNIKDLLSLKDERITSTILHAISKLGQKNSGEAKRLALLIDINKNSRLAEELCGIFDSNHGIPPEDLDKKDVENILAKLIQMKLFDTARYHIDKFLEFVSKKYPDLSISFLIKRLRHYKLNETAEPDYRPFPYLGFRYAFAGISKTHGYEEYVRRIRDFVLDEAMKDSFWLPKLFEIVSDGYCEKSLEILDEWLEEGARVKIEAVPLLVREAPDTFLFENYNFVGKVILSAKKISDECLRNVQSDLFSIAISGEWSRGFGVPSDKGLRLKKMGKEISEKLDSQHPAHEFYLKISRDGEARIQEEFQRDEELLDE